MSKLKLVMATSLDGVVSLNPEDDMTWTGRDDKSAFRLLTSVGGVLGAGRRTFEKLPPLKGRTVRCISTRRGYVQNAEARRALDLSLTGPDEPVSDEAAYELTMTLGQFAHQHPDGWLIGGQTIALEALSVALVGEAFLCRAPVELRHALMGDMHNLRTGQPDRITPLLRSRNEWSNTDAVRVGDTVVEVWRRK